MDILALAGFGWVKPWSSARDQDDGKRGCFQAHIAAVAQAASVTDCECVWLFEDDVAFSRPISEREQLEIEAIAAQYSTLVAVGGMAISCLSPLAGSVYRGRWNYTHAYVVPRALMAQMGALRYTGEHYDRVLSRSLPQSLIHPGIAYQRPASLSTTSDSCIYHTLTSVRNAVGAWNIQAILGWFWLAVAWVAHLLGSCKGSKVAIS